MLDLNVNDEQSVAAVVKFPCRPIALRSTATFPPFLTWTVTLVVFPETESVRRLAVRLPRAFCRNPVSFFDSWCCDPTCSWPCPCACSITPTDEGMSW